MAENNKTHISTGKRRGPNIRKFDERKHAARISFAGAILRKFGLINPDSKEDLAQAKIKLQNFLEEKLSEL